MKSRAGGEPPWFWNIPMVLILAVYIDYQYSVSAMICLTLRLNRQPHKKNNNFNPYKINRNYSMERARKTNRLYRLTIFSECDHLPHLLTEQAAS